MVLRGGILFYLLGRTPQYTVQSTMSSTTRYLFNYFIPIFSIFLLNTVHVGCLVQPVGQPAGHQAVHPQLVEYMKSEFGLRIHPDVEFREGKYGIGLIGEMDDGWISDATPFYRHLNHFTSSRACTVTTINSWTHHIH